MQFVPDGPDIPDELLLEHEEGRVVFFCGAGVSCPSRLPTFEKLVDKIYTNVGTNLNDVEKMLYQANKYDEVLDVLEKRIVNRDKIRLSLTKILIPTDENGNKITISQEVECNETATHKAMLRLALDRNDVLRLVTTNFDTIFFKLSQTDDINYEVYKAPCLPVPKLNRWNGIVYLHGLLPETSDQNKLNELVLTSGDFGRAYLFEGWAARFVSELFRTYIVCFVGYSANDPVIRYFMDALAADRIQGRTTPVPYAFVSECEKNNPKIMTYWNEKGIKMITYQRSHNDKHINLHNTLKAWAKTYSDIQGKEKIVAEYAQFNPYSSTTQDDFVSRMNWAISDKSGLPAQKFSKLTPVPSFKWFDTFTKAGFIHENNPNRTISSGMERIVPHMFDWLTKHLNNPRLLRWVIYNNIHLNGSFSKKTNEALDNYSQIRSEHNGQIINRVEINSPNDMPSRFMEKLWRYALSGKIKKYPYMQDLLKWQDRLSREYNSKPFLDELRVLLAPKILLRFSASLDNSNTLTESQLRKIIHWNLVLASDDVSYFVDEVRKISKWKNVLLQIHNDIASLLCDALEITNDFDDVSGHYTYGLRYQSINTSRRNNGGSQDWLFLIEILIESWEAIYTEKSDKARYIVYSWLQHAYPIFRRLVLYAAAKDNIAPNGEWVHWLLEEKSRWLWSKETHLETFHLLVKQGSNLNKKFKEILVNAILNGPDHSKHKIHNDTNDIRKSINREICLRLMKLKEGNCRIGKRAEKCLDNIYETHPEFRCLLHKIRDSVTSLNMAEDIERGVLINQHQDPEDFSEAKKLRNEAKKGKWPVPRWIEVLQTWNSTENVNNSWVFMASTFATIPDDKLKEFGGYITLWLRLAAKTIRKYEQEFLKLCGRILDIDYENENQAIVHIKNDRTRDPVLQSLNHPTGQITEAIINFWTRYNIHKDEGIPEEIKILLTKLTNKDKHSNYFGRVILASRTVVLFLVDKEWTKQHLRPFFSWDKSQDEAYAVWSGFVWAFRYDTLLMKEFKVDFLKISKYFDKMGEWGRQYISLLIFIKFNHDEIFCDDEFRGSVDDLPEIGRSEILKYLIKYIKTDSEDNWHKKIQPFLHKFWSKNKTDNKNMSYNLAWLAIESGDNFQDACDNFVTWLNIIDEPNVIYTLLNKSGLCRRFPKESLSLLNKITGDPLFISGFFKECLIDIKIHNNRLSVTPEFRRLENLARQND